MFVRLAKVKDCQEIYDLIKDGDSGMTTLPKSKKEVLERISWSKKSLNKKIKRPDKDSYLFVLKENNKIVGISAIYTSVSKNGTSVFFKRKKKNIASKSFNFKKSLDVIQLHTVKNPYTELGTLFCILTLEEKVEDLYYPLHALSSWHFGQKGLIRKSLQK